MRNLGFWKSDWFLGVVVSLLFAFLGGSDLMQSLERKAYDLGVHASSRAPSDKVAVIAIDDESISNIGRWPWSRDVHAKMVDLLAKSQAKVIGYTVFFFEPQTDPGLVYIDKLIDQYNKTNPSSPIMIAPPPVPAAAVAGQQPAGGAPQPVVAMPPAAPPAAAPAPSGDAFASLLVEAERALNTDLKLANSMQAANNVLLPVLFQPGEPQGNPDKPLPDYVIRNNLAAQGKADNPDDLPLSTIAAFYPIKDLGAAAAALGHLTAKADVDGGIRTEPLVVRYYDQFYPSLSLMLAAKSLNLGTKDIQVNLGQGVKLGNLKIATDSDIRMHTYFYKDHGDKPAFQVDSFYDVYSGKIPPEKYRDKVVLIGATAAGVGSLQVTPISPAMPPVLTLAHSVSSILKEDFFVAPTWGVWVELLVFLLVAAYLTALLPRLKAAMGAMITAAIFAALITVHFILMGAQAMWLQLMLPATLLLVGHGTLTTKRFLVTEKGKLKSEAESAESNRMLGLAFQGQGQLDMAFDKFRKLPVDNSVMDLLYNLALDFERKRQFNKAEAVFRHMADFNPKYRDLEQKLMRAKAMSETVILGGASGGRTNVSLLETGGAVEKPMLGRYQVEKELGKGAMGVVYLGRDPKINRVVAIKTMALSQEFEADELEDVKARFFREAETAGRLNHPHIVTIFDAGEEHDLAYIAMEFLKGKDLVGYIKPDNLLPLPKVMSIVARVAEALGYAHTQNVVHRDVKPANIMWEPDADSVKVTDFGIARITDSSKTKTGMVLGTPSYMSPEQLTGKKIDGRSDLFSLGVSLFQMSCGKLPFVGDSMAQLMFKIANEEAEDPAATNPAIPECLSAIIKKAMSKDMEQRYQTGDEMARDLKQCMGQANTVDITI